MKQFQKLFEIEGVNLRFTDSALSAIAKESIKRDPGARGLGPFLKKPCWTSCMKSPPSAA